MRVCGNPLADACSRFRGAPASDQAPTEKTKTGSVTASETVTLLAWALWAKAAPQQRRQLKCLFSITYLVDGHLDWNRFVRNLPCCYVSSTPSIGGLNSRYRLDFGQFVHSAQLSAVSLPVFRSEARGGVFSPKRPARLPEELGSAKVASVSWGSITIGPSRSR